MTLSILAYGDSLTWGRNPENGDRHAEENRWPCVVEAELGEGTRVHAEGLRGRTTIFDDLTAGFNTNGANYLPTVLSTHQPLDLVVLMLGTNDLKPAVCGSVEGVVVGLKRLVTITRTFPYHMGRPPPDILIVSPPIVCTMVDGSPPAQGRCIEESKKLAPAIKSLCEGTRCYVLDAAEVARSSQVDGVHLDAENTKAIGLAVARFLRAQP